jgi:hypothetical protein
MIKIAILFFYLGFPVSSFGKDCGPISPGATVGLNCEIVPVSSSNQKKAIPSLILEISLQSGSESEKQAKSLLERLANKHNLTKYFFTKKVHIQSFVIPHSHPVLTLNTRNIKEPDRYLSLFLHEQIHWFFVLDRRDAKTKAFIDKMKGRYPTVPSQNKGGARDDESTYLHLGVCFYELELLSKLIGKEKAEQVFKSEVVYSWVRQQVLANRGFIQSALNETGLQWQDAGS